MIKKSAALTRVGWMPAAAALVLLGSVTAWAEDAPPADAAAAAAKATGTPPDKDAKVPDPADAKSKEAAETKPDGAPPADKAADAPKAPEADAAKSAAKVPDPAEAKPQEPAETKADGGAPADKAADKTPAAQEPAEKAAADPAVKPESQAKPAEAAAAKDGAPAAEAPASSTTSGPASTAALPDAAADAQPGTVADTLLPPADPIVAGIRQSLPDAAKGASEDEAAALAAFYDGLSGPAVWVSTDGLTAKAKAVAAEFAKADDWGLSAADFQMPAQSGTLTPEAAAEAEIRIALTVLKYARYARGGRVNPSSISRLLDQSPPLRAPKTVLTEIAAAEAPDAYLRSLHPQHEQFQALRQVLLKLRGTEEKVEEPEEDPALSVRLPPGRLIRVGMEDEQVALLRKRLKVPAEDGAQESLYDENLKEAVAAFQREKGLRPDGMVGNQTRAALNGQAVPVVDRSKDAQIERILINMERWRWMPEDLGAFYVWDNTPEFLTRIVKNGKVIHTDKLVVGQPTWPTPVFSADMKLIVFNPQWGVPDGIKTKELWPLLRNSSGGFFGIFGGGGYSSQAVLDAHDLRVSYNGRPIDPNQVDWNSVDIRRFSFTQPPGPKNVLGAVKFMFPNKHDVYMHDTPERNLFARGYRALSHGCMRVEQPRRLAEILLAEDKGWSAEQVRGMFGGYSNEVQLDKHIPVHVTYFTARVDEDGKLRTFGDMYGLDARVAAAVLGRPVRFETPAYADEEVAYDSGAPAPRRQGRKKQYQQPPTLADAISGLFSP